MAQEGMFWDFVWKMSLECQPSSVTAEIIPTQTHANAHFFSYMHHSALSAHFRCGKTTLAQGEKEFVSHSSALISISLAMSLLNVPFSRCPQVLFSPTCPTSQTSATSTSFCGSRNNPCASARWSGMSVRLPKPTQNTSYEPNFYSYLNEDQEHAPIHFPDSFPCRDDATIISAAEDPEVPYSGACSSSKQAAASRVLTMLGSLGASPWKQRPELIDSRASILATGADVVRESVVSTFFSSQSKGKRSRSKRCAFVERQRKSPTSLNGKLTRPSEER